jgi:hypothetical protein
VREPWNPLIKQCLDAVDRHEELYRTTGNGWHAAKAQDLRWYVAELKDWIHAQERVTTSPDLPTKPGTSSHGQCYWRALL